LSDSIMAFVPAGQAIFAPHHGGAVAHLLRRTPTGRFGSLAPPAPRTLVKGRALSERHIDIQT
jgi:hypothetical protein